VDLDALCASGDLVWIGAGSLGADDGRVSFYVRDQVRLLAPPPPEEPPAGELHASIREHLAGHGASFWPDLVQATGTADERVVLAALWDLVWAGEVTNDTPAPLRALTAKRSRATPRPGSRPRPGALRRTGPPAGAGRWSLVAPLLEPKPTPTESAHARALQLLDRHGVLTREAVLSEGVPGGFAGVYGVLKALEMSGKVRRGYFVAGLGAAQFAVPGAVDRIRALRDPIPGAERTAVLLAATDPAQPYGAALPWPEGTGRPARQAGAFVVLVDGALAAFLERGARSLLTFGVDVRGWVDALASLPKDGRLRKIELTRIDGGPANDSPIADGLRSAGFTDGYRGLTLRG
jgi:ATP-dependent Lhr-like helicase